MAGWGLVLEPSQLRGLGLCFYLARQPVPEVLRQTAP